MFLRERVSHQASLNQQALQVAPETRLRPQLVCGGTTHPCLSVWNRPQHYHLSSLLGQQRTLLPVSSFLAENLRAPLRATTCTEIEENRENKHFFLQLQDLFLGLNRSH